MYDSWYLDQYDQYNDFFHEDFDIFGLKSQGPDTRLGQPERLNSKNILDWVERSNHQQASPSRVNLKLLLTRHKRHQHREIKPWYMAFQKSTFRSISSAWKLPSDYLFLRKNAAGCGTYKKNTIFNDSGSASHLGFTIRVPHSPRNNAKAIWSMAVSWDASSGHASALFEGVSDADIQEVQRYLQAKQQIISHPLLLPTMLLEILNTFFIDHRREAERSLYLLEHQLGITRGKRQIDVWDWDYELHRESTKHCNSIYTDLVYLERRLEFAVGLSQFLLESLASIEEEGLLEGQESRKLLGRSKMIKETVLNSKVFAERALHQILCLQKRCQGLASVLYMVIAQQDSKINVKIARAAKRDSSSMTAIAVLTMIFLPAMLVATIFSMSMFDFSPDPSAGRNSIVSSKFWVYWVVTGLLTLAVLIVWRVWMHFHTNKSGEDGESLKREKLIAVQSMREANLALNTPFYPVNNM